MTSKKLLQTIEKEKITDVGVHNVGFFIRLITEEYGPNKTMMQLKDLIESEFNVECPLEIIERYQMEIEHQDYMDKLAWAVANGLIDKPNFEY